MSNKKQHKKKKVIPKEEIISKAETKEISNVLLLVLTLLLAVIYFIFSTFSNGFYQHDEVGNFLSTQQIWHDSLIQILGANTKSDRKSVV